MNNSTSFLQLAFPNERLKSLSEEGYRLYQLATQTSDAEAWYAAGDKYDTTYTGL